MKDIFKLIAASILGAVLTLVFAQSFLTNQPVISEVVREVVSNDQNKDKTEFSKPTFTKNAMPSVAGIDFRYAAKTSIDAVVHVKTVYESKSQYYTDPFMEFFFGKGTFEQKTPRREGSGSGVIVSADGYIITNNHVINGADIVDVTLNTKKTLKATVVGTDPTTDLALLKIEGADLPHLPYGNSDNIDVGEWALAVGNPFNLRSTVTAGIISAKGRNINILNRNNTDLPPIESFIQTDAAVNPGNSGGALVNINGELIGINTAIQSNTGSYTGYSFAVPVNIVKKVINDLLEFGMVQRAFIGVSIQPLTNELVEEKGINTLDGIYISAISDQGAAADGGIKEGDVIVKIAIVDVKNIPELQEQLSKFRPGDKINVTVNRSNELLNTTITLRNRFGNTEVINSNNKVLANGLGAEFREITTEEKEILKIHGGVKIEKLETGKLKRAGIENGFIITKIDGSKIENYGNLKEKIENRKGGVLLEGVYPNGTKAYYGLGL